MSQMTIKSIYAVSIEEAKEKSSAHIAAFYDGDTISKCDAKTYAQPFTFDGEEYLSYGFVVEGKDDNGNPLTNRRNSDDKPFANWKGFCKTEKSYTRNGVTYTVHSNEKTLVDKVWNDKNNNIEIVLNAIKDYLKKGKVLTYKVETILVPSDSGGKDFPVQVGTWCTE